MCLKEGYRLGKAVKFCIKCEQFETGSQFDTDWPQTQGHPLAKALEHRDYKYEPPLKILNTKHLLKEWLYSFETGTVQGCDRLELCSQLLSFAYFEL